MRMQWSVAVLAAFFCSASIASGQYFEGLGALDVFPRMVSGDGMVVVGSTGDNTTVRWALDGGLSVLNGFSSLDRARDISTDGSVIVGERSLGNLNSEAFRWTNGTGIVLLGDLPGGDFDSEAERVSGDGSTVIGISASASFEHEAFRWTLDGGMIALGTLPGALPTGNSIASGVSHDGSVIVGGSDTDDGREAFRWTDDGGMVGLGDLPGSGFYSYAVDTSADGAVVVGAGRPPGRIFEPFRWTTQTGMIGLGVPSGGQQVEPLRGSSDGSVILGRYFDSAIENRVFIWDATRGMRDLQSVFTDEFGADFAGWVIDAAYDMSDDGKTIVGRGINPEGIWEGWIANLAITCDFDGDNLCNNADLDVLYDEISTDTGGTDYDLTGDGMVDNEDITEWLALAGAENGKTYLPGDANLDGEVGGGDFTTLAINFGNIGTDPDTVSAYWRHGNFDGQNGDGNFDVGGPDFTALALHFGHQSANSVPEPKSMGLVFLGILGLCLRSTKRLRRGELIAGRS